MSMKRAMKIIDDMVRRGVEEHGPGDATAIVCMQADGSVGFEDDKYGDCMKCGERVRYRPYMPDLPKICLGCAAAEEEGK